MYLALIEEHRGAAVESVDTPESSGIPLDVLCDELSVSLAELNVLCFKIGIDVFALDSGNTLSPSQAELIRTRSSQLDNQVAENTQSPKQNESKKAARPKTVVAFASEFELPVNEILELCHNLGFNEVDEERHLSRRQIIQLSNHLLQNEINLITQDDTRSTTALGSILEEAIAAPVTKKRAPAQRHTVGPARKRLSVLAGELDTSETQLKWLCDVIGIPLSDDSNPKFDLRYEHQLKDVVATWLHPPFELDPFTQVRLSKIAKRLKISLKETTDICLRLNIDITKHTFVSLQGEYRIIQATMGENDVQIIEDEFAVESADHSPQALSSAEERTQYRGVSLIRQDFSGVDFSNADMREVDLSYSTLTNAIFSRTWLDRGVLMRTVTLDADFAGASMHSLNADFAELQRSQFMDSDLRHASFVKANLSSANFEGADLSNANLRDAQVDNASFAEASFGNTTWIDGSIIHEVPDWEERQFEQ